MALKIGKFNIKHPQQNLVFKLNSASFLEIDQLVINKNHFLEFYRRLVLSLL